MKINEQTQVLSIKCGKKSDNFDYLRNLCEREAEKLLKTLEIPLQSTISVKFWTNDIPELICVGNFYKKEGDSILYDLDFSQTTL